MVKSTPLLRKRIVKKRTQKFARFQSDLYAGRLAPSWRRAHGTWWIYAGIDNRMRRRFRGNRPMPKIGYGSDKKTRYHLPNGLKKFVVHNIKDLDVLLMNNRTFCAEIAHNISSKVLLFPRRNVQKSLSEPSKSESKSPMLVEKSEPKKRNPRPDSILIFKSISSITNFLCLYISFEWKYFEWHK